MKLDEELQRFRDEINSTYILNDTNLVYLRLSKLDNSIKDKDKQIEDALNKLRSDFTSLLSKYVILQEKGFKLFVEIKSAYKSSLREEFINLYENHLFKDVTIKDILERDKTKKLSKKLFISSTDRLSRLFLYSLSFQLIRLSQNIEIYSLLDEENLLESKARDIFNKPNQDQLIYIFQMMLKSSNSQSHSEDLSNKIIKRVDKDKQGVTISNKTGKRWGKIKSISDPMRLRIKSKFKRFSALEISEQKDIYQIVKGTKKRISINTILKILRE